MKRIDTYKRKLENTFKETQNKEKLTLVFQELMNLLTTYDEKKEFHDHYEQLKKGLLLTH